MRDPVAPTQVLSNENGERGLMLWVEIHRIGADRNSTELIEKHAWDTDAKTRNAYHEVMAVHECSFAKAAYLVDLKCGPDDETLNTFPVSARGYAAMTKEARLSRPRAIVEMTEA